MTENKHTPETIFVKVFCKDRLPENNESYITDKGICLFFPNNNNHYQWRLSTALYVFPEWWLEEIPNLQAENERLKQSLGERICINDLLSEFRRQGINTENWDGDEGAEKAIVDGVVNIVSELQAENERLRKTALIGLETIKVSAEVDEQVSGYCLSRIIRLCDKLKKGN